jgi:hypothetical protein
MWRARIIDKKYGKLKFHDEEGEGEVSKAHSTLKKKYPRACEIKVWGVKADHQPMTEIKKEEPNENADNDRDSRDNVPAARPATAQSDRAASAGTGSTSL